jgi:hypothetical protein
MEILNVNETASFNFLTQSSKRKAKSHSVKFKVLNFELWFYALRFTLFAILASLCFFNCPAAQAADYYVDAGIGNDANPGTSGQPWKTITKAQSVAVVGDTVELSDGDYGNFSDNNAARTGYITYKAKAGHNPHFDNVDIISGAYLRFEGLYVSNKIDNVSFYVENGKNLEIKNCTVVGVGRHLKDSTAMKISESSNILVEGCEVSLAGHGLEIGGTHLIIRGCIVHGSSASSFRVTGADDILVENNLMFDADRSVAEQCGCGDPANRTGPVPDWGCPDPEYPDYNPIYSKEAPHENLAVFRGITNAFIRNNTMYKTRALGLTIRDGTVAPYLPYSGENIVLENNIVLGAQLWAMTGEITARNNFFDSVLIGAYSGTGGVSKLKVFANNIVPGNFGYYTDQNGTSPCDVSQAYQDYNIIGNVSNWGKTSGSQVGPHDKIMKTGITEFFVNYNLVTPEQSDLRLKSGVVAIDFCPVDYATSKDKDGNVRIDISDIGGLVSDGFYADAGTYEFQGLTLPAIIYGDISGDSALSAYDAALAARIAVGLDAYPTGDNLTKADVSGDGFVTAYDAALIAQKAVGLITKFPVES